ncbi:hypothetical protein K525DRAFT_292012 [Schizophyllum commune Loenen D]|nr:hypothetical protein K525DRAFT_292012 [Schizophyllum commune Loenen D]
MNAQNSSLRSLSCALGPLTASLAARLFHSSPGERAHTTVFLSSSLSPAAVRVLRKRRNSFSSPHTISKRQWIVVRQAMYTVLLRSPTSGLATPRLAGLATNEQCPTSHPPLKQCIFFRRARIYLNARSTIKTRTPEACALAQQLAHAVTDSAAPSLSRQLDWQLASAICKSSTPSASLDMSCKLNDFSFTLMTLPRLQLHLNHSPLTIEIRPPSGALRCTHSSSFPSVCGPRLRLRSSNLPRLKLSAFIPSCPALTSSFQRPPQAIQRSLKISGTLLRLLKLPFTSRCLPNDITALEAPRVIHEALQSI